MDASNVDPAVVGVWRWYGAIATVILTIGASILCLQASALWPLVPVTAIAGAATSWYWPALHYRHLRYAVDATGVTIQRGVLWRSRIALPRSRIQHTDVSQGPLQRRFGIGTLKLYTAGSRHTRIVLPGLAHARALALRDALLAQAGGGGV